MLPPHSKLIPSRCIGCELRGAALCREMHRTEASDLKPPRLRRVERDTRIFAEGQEPGVVGVLHQGLLRKERMGRDGRRTLLGLSFPGDIVGTVPGKPAAYTLEAATDAEICAFSPDTARRMLADNRHFRMHFLDDVSRQHANQLELIWRRGALTSRERIIAFLVTTARSLPVEWLSDGSLIVEIELSRRDWADLSNTTVESISRTLRQLAEKNLVETVRPGCYLIRDLGALTQLAGLDPDPEPAQPPERGEPHPPDITSPLTAVTLRTARLSRIDSILEKVPHRCGI